ncbi:unnamed protein product [Camellia sinensis]
MQFNDGTLVETGGGDDKGFLWKFGQGDWAFELQVISHGYVIGHQVSHDFTTPKKRVDDFHVIKNMCLV